MGSSASGNRNDQLIADRRAGKTMAQLGREYGISRERVRQILEQLNPDLCGNIICPGCNHTVLRESGLCSPCQSNLRVYGCCTPEVRVGDGDAYRAHNFWKHVEIREDHLIWQGEYITGAGVQSTGPIMGEQRPHRIMWRLKGYPPLTERARLYRTCDEPHCIAPEHRRVHMLSDRQPRQRRDS